MEKIRVLHCVTAMNRGGLETLIMNIYRNIDRDKFEFDFLVQRKGEFHYSDEIRKLGGNIYSVSSFNPFRIKSYKKEIDEFFKLHAKDYDIVHAHNNTFAMYVLRAAKKYGIKTRISHSHIAKNYISLKLPFVLYNKTQLKKYCNVRYACGKEAGHWLFGNEKFEVIHNAIDLSDFHYSLNARNEIRKKYNIDENTIVLGNVGRFEKQKNQLFLLKIMEKLIKENVNVILFLIGEGSLKGNIEKEIRENKIEDKVILTGNISNVFDYYSAMDVFVLPSLFEGLPVTLIEAQANGVQCLVSTSVARESKITNLISFMDLNDKTVNWCKKIIELSKIKHIDEMNSIISAGYEIKTATKELEKKYINLVKKNK